MRAVKLLRAAVAALAAAVLLTSCYDHKAKGVSSATIVCDESFQNIMGQEIDVFEYVYPKNFILCNYVPQAVAVDSLLSGKTRTAIIGRDLTKDERKMLGQKYPHVRSMKIAVDAVALIVNPENNIDAVSLKELSMMLTGKIKRWNEISPDGADQPINVIFDNPGSGLATFMRDSLLNGAAYGPNVSSAGSVPNVIKTVQSRKSAIGVIGVSWLTPDMELDSLAMDTKLAELQSDAAVDGGAINDRLDNSGVKVLKVMSRYEAIAYKPYQQYIYNGSYPLTRPMYIITTGSPINAVGKFYTFITSNDGQKLIQMTGIMPARLQVHAVELK
ncbi:MAG: PstS family phosphate ABC transporter substrate-binding protein [Muribaculaceae bacterium]